MNIDYSNPSNIDLIFRTNQFLPQDKPVPEGLHLTAVAKKPQNRLSCSLEVCNLLQAITKRVCE